MKFYVMVGLAHAPDARTPDSSLEWDEVAHGLVEAVDELEAFAVAVQWAGDALQLYDLQKRTVTPGQQRRIRISMEHEKE